ncbi:hypothetical protein VPH35_021639 [Triticum aestivum]
MLNINTERQSGSGFPILMREKFLWLKAHLLIFSWCFNQYIYTIGSTARRETPQTEDSAMTVPHVKSMVMSWDHTSVVVRLPAMASNTTTPFYSAYSDWIGQGALLL